MLNTYYTKKLIGLKDIILEKIEETNGVKHVYLHMEKRIHQCPKCDTPTSKVHDYRTQLVKDIPANGLHTVIHLRKRRHVCPCCGKRFAEKVDFLPSYQRTTNRLWGFVLSQVSRLHSMRDIAQMVNLSPTSIARIMDCTNYSCSKLPQVLSIDEFRGNSGGHKYQCILTDAKNKKVFDILPQRRLESLCAYFGQFENRKQVKYVIMDLSSLFRSMAQSCFPQAKIVADRFHVVKQAMNAFEKVRKSEQEKFSTGS